jgi:transposase
MSKKKKRTDVVYLVTHRIITDLKELDSYQLSECHPASAGIDLGLKEIYVALNPVIAAEMELPIVHVFKTFTSDLLKCKDLLVKCGVKTVSMESTSVYWTTIYSILEMAGIEVFLVNPRKFRMVPGRKTDVLDCQWLQTLHLYGLLTGSFHPEEKIAELRSYIRERDRIVKDRSRYINRMHKALVKMNLLLGNVLSDITGVTGLNIIKSILQGERDPKKLAGFRDPNCKKTEEEIAEALTGYYKTDQLVLLKINYDTYTFLDKQITEMDQHITALLKTIPLKKEKEAKCPPTKKTNSRSHKNKNDIRSGESMDDMLYRIVGTDLTAITGLQANAILQIISEVGIDMSKFPSAKHFASYFGFTPHNKITGGKIISSKTDRIKSHASQAFRKVIPSIIRGNSSFAAFYRRLATRIGQGKAFTATCRKLAMIFYNTLVHGSEYVEIGQEKYKQQQFDREKKLLHKLAKKHNLVLVQTE